MNHGQRSVIQSGITSSYVGCACGASQCRHVELKFWHWRQMISKAIFKTHWTVGLPQISVIFQFCCYFDLNFKSLILEFLIFGTHFYRFPFKLSTLQLGLSQHMNTLKAVDFKTALEACQATSGDIMQKLNATVHLQTASNYPYKSIMVTTDVSHSIQAQGLQRRMSASL